VPQWPELSDQVVARLQESVTEFARKIVDPSLVLSGSDLAAVAWFEGLRAKVCDGLTFDEIKRLLMRIAVRRLRDEKRKQQRGPRRQPLTAFTVDHRSIRSPDAELERREFAAFVLDRLNALPPDQAEVTRLYFIEGLRVTDIAERRECAKASVSKILARSLKRLRAEFDDR